MGGHKKVYRTDVCPGKGNGGCFGGSHAIIYKYDNIWRVLDYWMHTPWRGVDWMFWTPENRNYCVNMKVVMKSHEFANDIPKGKFVSITQRDSPKDGGCPMGEQNVPWN